MVPADSTAEATRSLTAEEVVRAVYRAFGSSDTELIERTVRQHFADDVVVHEAESLPWGGQYHGIDTVAAMTVALADPASPIDAANLVVDDMIVREGDGEAPAQVIAAVSFPWRGASTIPMRALEWWSLRAGRVTEIRVYLWDTAAAVSALNE